MLPRDGCVWFFHAEISSWYFSGELCFSESQPLRKISSETDKMWKELKMNNQHRNMIGVTSIQSKSGKFWYVESTNKVNVSKSKDERSDYDSNESVVEL